MLQPACSSNARVSAVSRARSAAPSSNKLPVARSRAIGRHSELRPDTTSWEPWPTWSASDAIASQLTVSDSNWTSSRITTCSGTMLSSEHTRCTAPVSNGPGELSIANRAGESGTTRSIATATCNSSATGSLSPLSTETQATGRRSREINCASSVVLPYPAGAETAITDASSALLIRSRRPPRATVPGRSVGGISFVSITPEGGAPPRAARREARGQTSPRVRRVAVTSLANLPHR